MSSESGTVTEAAPASLVGVYRLIGVVDIVRGLTQYVIIST